MTPPPQHEEAKELTKEERQERVDKCFDLETTIKDSIAYGRKALWVLAEALYAFHEADGWSALGYETQEEWLAQPEISMTRTAYFRLVRRWKELAIYKQVPVATLTQLEPSKLDIVMPVIEDNKAVLQNVLDDVQALGARDLRDKYIQPSHKPSHDEPAADSNGEVIEGKTVETDDEPVPASSIDVPGANGSAQAAGEADEKLSHSAGVVDSWMEMGGDRRKAQRHWAKLWELHPALVALSKVGGCIAGEEGAPEREEIMESWELLMRQLPIDVEEAT